MTFVHAFSVSTFYNTPYELLYQQLSVLQNPSTCGAGREEADGRLSCCVWKGTALPLLLMQGPRLLWLVKNIVVPPMLF